MRILLTSGATREPIDTVRFLSNISTGRTGALLADALAAHGHTVTLLHGETAVRPSPAVTAVAFSSTADLQSQLRHLLSTGGFNAVIHAAAVSDYRPSETHDGKLSSYATELTLRLVPTPKLLPELKSYAAPAPRPLRVIGFKLTASAAPAARRAAVAKLFAAGTVDAVIHNDMDDLATGDARPFTAWRTGVHTPEPLAGLPALTDWLHAFVSQ
jgi:phosphopantothenoylcysteine decarboxylase/phosphopantothenate--cysteine ligase